MSPLWRSLPLSYRLPLFYFLHGIGHNSGLTSFHVSLFMMSPTHNLSSKGAIILLDLFSTLPLPPRIVPSIKWALSKHD